MSTTAVLHSEWIKIKSVRASAGSLTAVVAVTLAITVLAYATVGQAEADNDGYAQYLPDRAGQQVLHLNPEGDLGAWAGLAVTGVWAAAALLAGWWAVRRRDA